jgi:hypothetical protein
LPRLGEWVDHQAGVDLGADRVQLKLERGRHAEVATAAAQSPEQIRLRIGRDLANRAIGRHHGGAEQVVDSHAMAPTEPAESTAEREPRNPGGGVDAERRRQAVSLRFAIEVAEQRARADARGSLRRVDADRAHARKVQHQSALGDRIARDVMPAAAHAQQHSMRRGEAHGCLNVAVVQATRDQRWAAIYGAVPDLASLVVLAISSADHPTLNPGRKRVDVGLAQLPNVPVKRKIRQ